jgi:hypothetical protein
MDLKQQQINLIENEMQIQEMKSSESGFSVNDYIGLREEYLIAKFDMNEIRYKMDRILHEIHSLYTFEGKIEKAGMDIISLQKIEEWFISLIPGQDTLNNILVENFTHQNQLESQRILVEKAENRRNIGFLQAEYDRDRGNEFEEHMGFQVGIRLPLTNPDKPDLNRRRIELIEDQADLVERKTEISLNCQLISLELGYLFDQLDLLDKEVELNSFLKMVSELPDVTPQQIIKAQKSDHKLIRLENELKWKVYRSYIDYLYFSGRLIEVPLRNYLSKNMQEI